MQPPEGPPDWAALKLRPFGMPPPISSTMVRSEMPIGTSTRPVLRIAPARANTLVPLLRPVPMAANHLGPRRRIGATLAHVSTLLISVGLPQRPCCAGNGGRGCGEETALLRSVASGYSARTYT